MHVCNFEVELQLHCNFISTGLNEMFQKVVRNYSTIKQFMQSYACTHKFYPSTNMSSSITLDVLHPMKWFKIKQQLKDCNKFSIVSKFLLIFWVISLSPFHPELYLHTHKFGANSRMCVSITLDVLNPMTCFKNVLHTYLFLYQ
jgi:hypothetical protein